MSSMIHVVTGSCSLLQSLDRVPRGLPPHEPVTPWASTDEVQQSIVHRLAREWVARGTSGDRLNALALPVGDNSLRVGCERLALLRTKQMLADSLPEEFMHSCMHVRRHLEGHVRALCTTSALMDIPP